LPKTGHFYFALTNPNFMLALRKKMR